MSYSDRTRWLIKVARKAKWRVEITRGSHVLITSPVGVPIYLSSTTSDRRSWLNERARLRRAGLKV